MWLNYDVGILIWIILMIWLSDRLIAVIALSMGFKLRCIEMTIRKVGYPINQILILDFWNSFFHWSKINEINSLQSQKNLKRRLSQKWPVRSIRFGSVSFRAQHRTYKNQIRKASSCKKNDMRSPADSKNVLVARIKAVATNLRWAISNMCLLITYNLIEILFFWIFFRARGPSFFQLFTAVSSVYFWLNYLVEFWFNFHVLDSVNHPWTGYF